MQIHNRFSGPVSARTDSIMLANISNQTNFTTQTTLVIISLISSDFYTTIGNREQKILAWQTAEVLLSSENGWHHEESHFSRLAC